MILELPIAQEGAHFGFTTELEGSTFGLTFRWNGRLEAWILDLTDGDGAPLVTGLRCVLNTPILRPHSGRAGLPKGDLLFFDSSGQNLEAGFEDLGRRVLAYFLPWADL